jgi:sirohydrochlorin cobaltochelatase
MRHTDLLLLGHGSRDPEGAREFLALCDAISAKLPGVRVAGGVLEFAGPVAPPIQDAADRLAAAGARSVLAQPVLLFHAGHDKEDMPRHLAEMSRRHPHIRFRLGHPIGFSPHLLALTSARARSALDRLAPSAEPTGLLLVARGTHHPDANGDMWKLARLFWEAYHDEFPLVEAAFVSLAHPFVPEGVARLVRLGARRIVVTPFFLNTGILVKRIAVEAEAEARRQGVPLAVSPHLGVDEAVVDALLAEWEAEVQPQREDG